MSAAEPPNDALELTKRPEATQQVGFSVGRFSA